MRSHMLTNRVSVFTIVPPFMKNICQKGKPEGWRPLARPRRRWEDNIKLKLQDVGWGGGVDWIDVTQNRGRLRAIVKALMDLRVP